MKENILMSKSFDFGLRIVRLSVYLRDRRREYVLSKQVLRSGTSIGANVTESTRAESRADFIHKLSVARKESFETEYWLRLIAESGLVERERLRGLLESCCELQKLLTASIKTAKGRSGK